MFTVIKRWNCSATETDETTNLAMLKGNCVFIMITRISRTTPANSKSFVSHITSHILELKLVSNDVRPHETRYKL